MDTPLISIIMSVHNSEPTLMEALESIFDQTYPNWELVICDDGSTDGTADLLSQAFGSIDESRLTILTNDTNRKLAYSLNRCLDSASGQFIARMDGDDISEPDRLERQLRFLTDHPEVDLVGTAMQRFSSSGLGKIVQPAELEPNRWTLGRSTMAPFCHATILARRSVFETVGNYTVSWRTERGQDLDLWYKFFAAGLTGRNLPEPLYRVREDQAAVRRRTPKARIGGFVTRVQGNWSLKYPPQAYVIAMIGLLKILVPYRIIDWNQKWSLNRSKAVERFKETPK